MLPTLNSMQQQETHQIMQPKAAKQTKVRRTRQPRNPQLSVARRNERERNRVKMVNNGFALLREHLPVEDQQATEQSGSDTPTPDGGSVAGGKSSKAKKFSKVETLRAAIQRIKMLEELIRSTEPGFESINLTSSSSAHLVMYDEEPLSVCEPLSCGSSSNSTTTTTMNQVPISDNHFQPQQTLYASQQHHSQQHNLQQEQFIKLEPQHCGQLQAIHNMPSPQNSQTSSKASNSSGLNTNTQCQPQMTQVHHLNHLQIDQQQPLTHHQSHLVPLSPISGGQQEQPSHTHLWIQQHQSSFMEQQHQFELQQQQQMDNTSNWYSQQQFDTTKQGNWFIQNIESPEQINEHQSAQHNNQQQQTVQHPNQVESPVWQYASSSPSTVQTTASPQLPQMPFSHHHQHHQISLYSQ